MRLLEWSFLFYSCLGSLCAVQITKGGTIPSYTPYDWDSMKIFLPYNAKAIIVGDRIAHFAANVAVSLECATVFCFSSEREDFQTLKKYEETLSNVHPYLGWFYRQPEGLYPYFATTLPVLFGEGRLLSTFYLPQFCERENLSKVDLIHLNCGGNELQVLQSCPVLVKNSIVIYVKTYHQRVREGISNFEELDRFMSAFGFELMTHYIYDGEIGDALYIKKRYLNGVFRSKEI